MSKYCLHTTRSALILWVLCISFIDTHAQEQHETGVVTGRVYDRDTGKALAGITVEAISSNINDWRKVWGTQKTLDPLASAITNDAGIYTLAGLPEGECLVYHQAKNDYAVHGQKYKKGVRIRVVANKTLEGMDFPLQHRRSVSGRVVDPEGKPIVSAKINGGRHTTETTSDSNGKFTLHGYRRGERTHVRATAEGYVPDSKFVHVDVDGQSDLTFTLAPAGTIEGRIVDADGNAVEKAHLSMRRYPSEKYVGMQFTNPEGHFSFEELPPGQYQIFKELNYDWKEGLSLRLTENPAPITLEPREHVQNLTFICETYESNHSQQKRDSLTGTIRGRVTNAAGDPLPEAIVHGPMFDAYCEVTMDEDAYYTMSVFGSKSKETTYLSIQHPGYMNAVFRKAPLGKDNFDIVLYPPEQITGTIRSEKTGDVIPNYRVGYVTFSEKIIHPDHGWNYYDPNGYFSILAHYNGPLAYWFVAEGYAPTYAEVTFTPGTPPKPLNIELKEEKVLKGMVTTPGGEPIANAAIAIGLTSNSLKQTRYRIQGSARAWSEKDGHFTIRGLPDKPLMIHAAHAEHLDTHQQVKPKLDKTTEVTLILPDACMVTGIATLNGKPLAGQKVNLKTPMEGQSDEHYSTVTDEAGRYTFMGIRPSMTTLSMHLAGEHKGVGSKEHKVWVEIDGLNVFYFEF